MKILVTGSNGFVGKNLISTLKLLSQYEILTFDRTNRMDDLKGLVEKADVIVHLAGCNRSENESDFKTINIGLTEYIASLLSRTTTPKKILFSSSTQVGNTSIYGYSKEGAEKILESITNPLVTKFIFRLPNIFGKWSKPNYNTVVATFCYNLSRNLPVVVNPSSNQVTFVYVDDVVRSFIEHINGTSTSVEVTPSFKLTIPELYERLLDIHESRQKYKVVNVGDQLTTYLLATYNYFLPNDKRNVPADKKVDQRGWLFEFVKSQSSGQIFISETNPGFTRGNHWHHTKVEKFCVIQGRGTIKFRSIFDGVVTQHEVSGENIQIIDIPTGHTHSITNTGPDKMITIFWASEIFDPNRPDTYFEEVEQKNEKT